MSFKKKIGVSCGCFSASRHSPHSRLAMLSALARSQVQLRTSPSPRAERSRRAGKNRTMFIIYVAHVLKVRHAKCVMPHTFPNLGNAAKFVGQTPDLRLVCADRLDPLAFYNRATPTRADSRPKCKNGRTS